MNVFLIKVEENIELKSEYNFELKSQLKRSGEEGLVNFIDDGRVDAGELDGDGDAPVGRRAHVAAAHAKLAQRRLHDRVPAALLRLRRDERREERRRDLSLAPHQMCVCDFICSCCLRF